MTSTPPDFPIADRQPFPHVRPTGETIDYYHWLSDPENPNTLAYLQDENAYADVWFNEHSETIDEIFDELKSRVQEDDSSAPVRHDDWWYQSHTEKGNQYVRLTRGRTAEEAGNDPVLDVNVEAEGHEFFSLGVIALSNNHRLVAWSSDTNGRERYTIRIRDIPSGKDLGDELTETTAAGVAWAADGHSFLYVLPDETERPYRVMRHVVGTAQSADTEVYRDDDERFFVGVSTTRSGKWTVIHSGSQITSEIRLLPANDLTAIPQLVRPREDGVEYSIDHWGDRFVITTNLNAVDFRVMTAPENDPSTWTEMIPHHSGTRLIGVTAFSSHIAIMRWRAMTRELELRFKDGTSRIVSPVDGPVDILFGANPSWVTGSIRVAVQSLSLPETVYDVDVKTGDATLVKQLPTPNVDIDQYVSDRIWATAEDGTGIPIDVVRHVDTPVDGTAPCLLYGYGSYESSIPPYFSTARLSLLDRGFVYALAHPRGGGEGGRQWYLNGKLLHKRNTFTDFISCLDALVDEQWAAPGKVAIRGGSAGGLLVGATVTMVPSKVSAVVAQVPFVDVVTTMSDPSLPLTVAEWEEWGDPREEPYASYMLSYSPYDNTVEASYPPFYVTAGLNDPRVSYHEPAKWVARLRHCATNNPLILLKTEMGAGHSGPSGRYNAWKDEARTLAFLVHTVADPS